MKEDVKMLEFVGIVKIDVFNYTIEDLESIVEWELIEIRNEMQYLLGDTDCLYHIGHSKNKIRQILYYHALDYFIKTEEERQVSYLNSTTLKYSTAYLQVTEK